METGGMTTDWDPVQVIVEWHVRGDARLDRGEQGAAHLQSVDRAEVDWLTDLLAHAGRAAAYRTWVQVRGWRRRPTSASVQVHLGHRAGVALTGADAEIWDGHRVEEPIRALWPRVPEIRALAVAVAREHPEDREVLLHGWETLVSLDGSQVTADQDPLIVLRDAAAAVPRRWLPRLALAGLDVADAVDLVRTHNDEEDLTDLLDRLIALRQA